jgi:hypothetical protein
VSAGDPDRVERRAARDRIVQYHEEQLGLLLEDVREGVARLLDYMQAQSEPLPDWWEAGEPHRRS